ncbi:MAG: winged helix-turn-helix domain-containing protein [Methanolobus sp.]|nr:winged helix-turn-helix domain-containing protein [Methanolobus sp.]
MNDEITSNEKNGIYLQEFENLRSEIIALKRDVNRVLEHSDNRHMNTLLQEMKGDLSRPVINYMLKDTKDTVEKGFCVDCDNKEFCKPAFSSLLHEMALLLLEDNVTGEHLKHFRQRFDELKSLAISDNCDECVESASRIFEKQMELISSFNKSRSVQGAHNIINAEDTPDDVVTQICEPLANKQRLVILRSVKSDTKSFSQLSRITGLRGGNLLFHIQKLLDTGMIYQRNERGDYMITRKGHMTLRGMSELYYRLLDTDI